MHAEATSDRLTVAAVCIDNPDRSTFAIQHGHAAQTPSGLAEIVSDDFPVRQDRCFKAFAAIVSNCFLVSLKNSRAKGYMLVSGRPI